MMYGARRHVRVLSMLAVAAALADPASAGAQPAGFPNLGAFTDAPANVHFSRDDRSASGHAYFRTPDGLSCTIGSVTQCSGPLPGLPAGFGGACAEVLQTSDDASVSAPFRFTTPSDDCPSTTDDLLAAGQKLTFTTNYRTTCVVGAGRLTACIQNDHGFVLQPSGSWVF